MLDLVIDAGELLVDWWRFNLEVLAGAGVAALFVHAATLERIPRARARRR